MGPCVTLHRSCAHEAGPDLNGQLGPQTEPSEGQNQREGTWVRTALYFSSTSWGKVERWTEGRLWSQDRPGSLPFSTCLLTSPLLSFLQWQECPSPRVGLNEIILRASPALEKAAFLPLIHSHLYCCVPCQGSRVRTRVGQQIWVTSAVCKASSWNTQGLSTFWKTKMVYPKHTPLAFHSHTLFWFFIATNFNSWFSFFAEQDFNIYL